MIKAEEVKLVNELQISDSLWRFACVDVFEVCVTFLFLFLTGAGRSEAFGTKFIFLWNTSTWEDNELFLEKLNPKVVESTPVWHD